MIKVGVIGANPDRSWAARAHIPALRTVEGYALTALATSRRESAREAARRFGADHAFTDARELAAHPEVDLVVITVKVPMHAELVRHALAAGKHVYCEWPLALNTGEAIELAGLAADSGVIATVGLQTRYSPAIAYARELIADGYLGEVTAATLLTARAKGGDGLVPAWSAYTLDSAFGAGSLEVMGGHALDAVEQVLGEPFAELSATLAVRRPRLTIAETGAAIEVSSADHIALHGTSSSGALISAHIRDGEAGEPRTRLEIAGTKGNLAVVSLGGDSWADVQFSVGDLGVRTTIEAGGSWRALDIPARHQVRPGIAQAGARNLSRMYRQLSADIHTGSQRTPDFPAGVRLHRLLDAVRCSASTGIRQSR